MLISKILEYWYTYLYLATALSPCCHCLALPWKSQIFTDEGIYSLQKRGPQLHYKDKGPFWLLDTYFIPKVIKHFGVYSWIYTSIVGLPGLGFRFPWNGGIPRPHRVTWSQPINMHPVKARGRAEKPAGA